MAIGAENTGGTNTISAPIVLASSTGTSTVYQESGGTLLVSGLITGAGKSLTKSGGGTLTLSNTGNTFGGATSNVTINAGVLSVPAQGALGSTSNTIIFNGGTLQFTNASGTATTTGRTMTFNSTAIVDTASPGITSSSAVTFSGALGGSAGLTKTGTGMLIISGGSNTYGGATTINAGTLRITVGDNRLPTGTNLVIDSANSSTFDLNALNQTVAQLSNGVNGGGIVGNIGGGLATTSTLTVTGTSSFGGTIVDGASTRKTALTKSTGGTLTLTGNNTYTGATLVSGGTLEIANSNSTSSGRISGTTSITVNSGGTLLLSGSSSFTDRINNSATMTLAGGTFNTGGLSEVNGAAGSRTPGIGALTLTANSTIDFGAGASIIEFAGLGAHTPITGADLLITNWTGAANAPGGTDQLLFAGTTTDFTAKFDQTDVSFNGLAGYNIFQITPGYYEVTAVPETSTWVIGALALGAIGVTQRRRIRKRLRVIS